MEEAVQIATQEGATDPAFHGEVTFEIREGSVKEVAVLKTFREVNTK